MITQIPSPSNIPGYPQVDFYEDITYGTHEREKIDMYVPKSAPSSPRPALIWIHGGSFVSGDKNSIQKPANRQIAAKCLQNNITVISINYILANRDYEPEGLLVPFRSAFKCLKSIKQAASVLNIDPDNLIYMGTSAGGYLSQWFSMHESNPNGISIQPKAAASKSPNISMNLFRIEELGLLGNNDIDYVLSTEQKFRENCRGWFGLEDIPQNREDLSQFPSLQIMWKLDPFAQNMWTSNMKPLYMISTEEDEDPDEMVEYIHNANNVQAIFDLYEANGVECYSWGTHPTDPVPNLPDNNRPEFFNWLIQKFSE